MYIVWLFFRERLEDSYAFASIDLWNVNEARRVLVLPCNRVTGLPRHSLTVRSLLKTLSVPQVNRHLDQEMKCMNVEDFFFLLNRLCSIQFLRRLQLLSRTSSLCVVVIKSSQVCEPVKAGFLWGGFIGSKLNLQAGHCSQNIVLFRLVIQSLLRHTYIRRKYVMGCGGCCCVRVPKNDAGVGNLFI